MPDIHAMTLDALPDLNDLYENAFCEEHGSDQVRYIGVHYTDLTTNKKYTKDVRFCMECVIEHPGENQAMYIQEPTNKQGKDIYG